MTDNIELTLHGNVTVSHLRYQVRERYGKGYDVNWSIWCKEREQRIRTISTDPLVRIFTVPIAYHKEQLYV